MCNIAHSYNLALHTTIGHSPFEVCLGYQPLEPIDVEFPISQSIQPFNIEKEADKVDKFIEKIKQLQQQVHDILE